MLDHVDQQNAIVALSGGLVALLFLARNVSEVETPFALVIGVALLAAIRSGFVLHKRL